MSEYLLSDDQNNLSAVGQTRAGADKVFRYKAVRAMFGCKDCASSQRIDKRFIIWVHQHQQAMKTLQAVLIIALWVVVLRGINEMFKLIWMFQLWLRCITRGEATRTVMLEATRTNGAKLG